MKFMASLQGVDLDKAKKEKEGWFGDPADYEHLSPEEREELTKKMMGQHGIATQELMRQKHG